MIEELLCSACGRVGAGIEGETSCGGCGSPATVGAGPVKWRHGFSLAILDEAEDEADVSGWYDRDR